MSDRKATYGNRSQEMHLLILIFKRQGVKIPKGVLKIIFEELKIIKFVNTITFDKRKQDYQLSRKERECDFVRIHKKVEDRMYFNELPILQSKKEIVF